MPESATDATFGVVSENVNVVVDGTDVTVTLRFRAVWARPVIVTTSPTAIPWSALVVIVTTFDATATLVIVDAA